MTQHLVTRSPAATTASGAIMAATTKAPPHRVNGRGHGHQEIALMTTPSVTAAFPWTEGKHYEVDPATGCWNWTGKTNARGYGYGYVSRRGNAFAHRVAYEDAFGEIAQGLHVHHCCENQRCLNPAHLEAITPSNHSVLHGRAKSDLTEQDIVDMRTAVYDGERIYDVAARYGITATTCGLICQGKKWRTAPGPIGAKPKNCAWCDRPLPLETTRNPRKRKYCDTPCRNAANNARKAAA